MRKALTVVVALAIFATPTVLPANEPPVPILVTGMVHHDPLPTVPETRVILSSYREHRDGWLWYLRLAERTGLRLSAQVTGPYAEACVRQGHASDFASAMPGGPHHVGTHLHANVKAPRPYVWELLPQELYHRPEAVARILADNIPWVNAIFEENGFSSRDNTFLHGSHATYPGMERDLFGLPFLSYDNLYSMVGAIRGRYYPYRGPWLQEPHEQKGPYVKLSEVGGIIGNDRPHGPEGMVYGTVPYQRRDFLRAYIEWREVVRHGDCGPIRHFNWMVHPYQLARGHRGTDGLTTRKSITELVEWLTESFINKTDDTGSVMARFANAGEIQQAFETWEDSCPREARHLQRQLEKNQPPLYLPAILERLDTTYHSNEVETVVEDVTMHRFVDHDTGEELHLLWAHGDTRLGLDEILLGPVCVLYGDGTREETDAGDVWLEAEPILVSDPVNGC